LYLPYCDYFSFAAPRGIINISELPAKVGLIEFWLEEKKQWDQNLDREYFVKSEIIRKCKRLDPVSTENYIKILEGIALKATVQKRNIF